MWQITKILVDARQRDLVRDAEQTGACAGRGPRRAAARHGGARWMLTPLTTVAGRPSACSA